MPKGLTLRNVTLLCLIPFVFACSKSKFSAKKVQPVPTQQTNSPRVQPDDRVTPLPPPPKYPKRPYPRPPEEPCDSCLPPPPPPPCNTCGVIPTPRPEPIKCFTYEEKLDGYKQGAQGVNLILAVDTSKSMENKRVATVRALVDIYVKGLARQVPMTVAVITGHSDKSPDSVVGGGSDFFYVNKGEPAIVRFEPGRHEQNKRAFENLLTKITDMRTDNTSGISDGGELLLNNFTNLMHRDRVRHAINMGALSPRNALGIVFIADENDICFNTTGMPGHKPSTKVTFNGKKVDRERVSKYIHCDGVDSAQAALDSLATLQHQGQLNYIFASGLIYTGQTPVPTTGQDEKGHGYIEFISALSGYETMFDLGEILTGDPQNWANEKMQTLAQATNEVGDMYVRRQITRGKKPIPRNAIKSQNVYVDGRQLKYERDYYYENDEMLISGCSEQSTIKVEYCVHDDSGYVEY